MHALLKLVPGLGVAEAAPRVTDRQLLADFSRSRTEATFNQLIQRHGTMVLGVCRRLLRNEHDIEDAFQAVFLVLARRAGDVRWQDSIGGWLHETAVRVATHARARDLKRREYETRALDMRPAPETAPEYGRTELREIFDDEIRRMPQKYQLPLVLCYLEGKSHVEAAAELGWPVGSVKGRLSRAREELRQRLVKRGITVTGAAFATLLLKDSAIAAVPYPLAAAATRGALEIATGSSVGISVGVTELVEAALVRRSLFDGLPIAAGVGVVIASLAVGLGLLGAGWWDAHSAKEAGQTPKGSVVAAPLAPREQLFGVWRLATWLEAGQPRSLPDDASAGFAYDRLELVIGSERKSFGVHLNASTRPRQIDLKTEAAGIPFTQLGIYEVSGQTVRICWAAHGDTRPATFSSTGEDRQNLLILEQQPAAELSDE